MVVQRVISNVEALAPSITHETKVAAPAADEDTQLDAQDEGVYDKFKPRQKWLITALLSLGGFNSNLSSQLVSPAIPEIAAAFRTTGSVINLSNALYILFMGLSTFLWGPMSDIYGKRWIAITSAALFFICSIGTALSSSLAAFFVFRILSAVMGTAFQVIGPACISDTFSPTTRGTALGWFVGGTLLAPSIGPFIGGVIVAFESWRVLFWFQTGLVGLSCALTAFLLPETAQHQWIKETKGMECAEKTRMIQWANPLRVLHYFLCPKILLLGMASSSIIWNMQSLLTPVRYVINPRFNLSSPLLSGLFYLAPGVGYMAGSFVGGQLSDQMVRRWMERRGRRIPEDRLRSSFIAMGIAIPGSIIVYGWAIDQEKGGIPLPVICMFIQGLAQMVCLPCLNAYALEVVEGKGSEVMGNLFIRYTIGAVGTAVCLPGIETIGVGWMSTISALFVAVSTASMCWVAFSAGRS